MSSEPHPHPVAKLAFELFGGLTGRIIPNPKMDESSGSSEDSNRAFRLLSDLMGQWTPVWASHYSGELGPISSRYRAYEYAVLELGRDLGAKLFGRQFTQEVADKYTPLPEMARPDDIDTVKWLVAQANAHQFLSEKREQEHEGSLHLQREKSPGHQGLDLFLGRLSAVRKISGINTNCQKGNWWSIIANQRMEAEGHRPVVKLCHDDYFLLRYSGQKVCTPGVLTEAPLPENFDLTTFCFEKVPTESEIENSPRCCPTSIPETQHNISTALQIESTLFSAFGSSFLTMVLVWDHLCSMGFKSGE